MSEAIAVNLKHPDRFFVGGEWVKPSTERKLDVVSPSTEQTILRVAEAREADVDRAVAAARKAFDEGPWPTWAHAERAERLRAMAKHLRERAAEISQAWTGQVGVVLAMTKGAGNRCADIFDLYANLAATYPWEEQRKPSYGKGIALLVREPVGVVAAITPWNAPLEVMTIKIAPALLAGCTVIMKPSPETPIEAYILAEAAEAAGLPPGVLNLLAADRDVSDYLVQRPGVDKVSFTGSTAAGRRIASVCGSRIARVTLELGGKSAAIVLDDFSVADAVGSLSRSACMMTGQVCAALTRVVVPRARHDEFVDGFKEAFVKVRVGDPFDPNTQMGPLAMKRQLARVEGYIAKGKEEGAKLATGGHKPKGLDRGYYIEPTLFANVDSSMTIAQEEIFGPVLSLIPYDTVDDAVRIANDTIYGLNGAVYTNDNDAAYAVARRVRTGNFAQSGFKIDFTLAFGGFKQSGMGREGGTEGLLPYLETKTVFLNGVPSGRGA
ncbi:MAG: aldehyde dehydrogenase [Candidatus Binatia bacterium]